MTNKKRAPNGSVPGYFDADYKTSYQKKVDEVIALRSEVAELKKKLRYTCCNHPGMGHDEDGLMVTIGRKD